MGHFPHYFGTMSKLFGFMLSIFRSVIQLTLSDLVFIGLKRDTFHMDAFVPTFCERH